MKSDLLKKHSDAITELARKHGANSICVFGSFARGEEDPRSDIDFLIDLDPTRSLLDIISLKHGIEDLIGRKVDIVTKKGISPYLVDQVIRESIPL